MDIVHDLDVDVPRWLNAAFFDEADELRLNQPPVQRHLIQVEPKISIALIKT